MGLDAIVVGAGHNGLVTAAYLAKAGWKVLVLERRETIGGAAATEEIFPGCRVSVGAQDAGLFLTEVVSDLDLRSHGFAKIRGPVAARALQPGGPRPLTLWRNPARTTEEIAKWSAADAGRYSDFVDYMKLMAGALRSVITLTPPVPHDASVRDLARWVRPALKVRGLGRRNMMEFLRILPMSARELLDDWFESDALKGVLGSSAVIGAMQGPMASGTAFRLLYHYMGEQSTGFRSSTFVKGGVGRLSDAVASAARENGAELRTGSPVERILLKEGAATGVRLADGEEISGRCVVSGVDPRVTFFRLVGAPELGPEFNRKVDNIRFRGTTATLHLLLDAAPTFVGAADEDELSGHTIVCPSLEYLERAYDDAKYGRLSARPCLDVAVPTLRDPTLAPEGHHLASIQVRYAPYQLRDAEWDDAQRASLTNTVLELLDECLPGTRASILDHHLITPLDWERDYGLTEGGEYHGQMGLDQLLFMRPVAGWGRYRTPIDNLFMCGSGTHPGGGVTGAPGYNAAREILRDGRRRGA